MPNSVHLIPRNRLHWIPRDLRLAHEYCFFLHDECVRMLTEYEGTRAHFVTVKFKSDKDALIFQKVADNNDSITSLRKSGYEAEARRVILNQITMAMVSDCLHHLYEALRCFEKRKVVVALNLLRKPLTDNLLYLSWMWANEDEFYSAFTTRSPKGITSSILKQRRREILTYALSKTSVSEVLDADFLDRTLFDRGNLFGLQQLFQHAVHLITIQHVEMQTESENFNFIFKDITEDDIYESVYSNLPYILLYLSHVINGLFTRIAPPSERAQTAFLMRSTLGFYLTEGEVGEEHAIDCLDSLSIVRCPDCAAELTITPHNAARLTFTESYRCTNCRRVQPFPFSWIF